MQEIDKMRTDGTYEELTKKETLMLDREKEKLDQTLGGISNMNHLPGAVFVVDTIKEDIAVNEAVKLHIPIIAMADSNTDPDIPDYIVPCNDDSARTIQLISSTIADAIIEGNAQREAQNEEELLEKAAGEATKTDTKVKEKKKATGTRRKRRRRKRKKDQKIQPEDSSDDASKNDSSSEEE